MVLLYTVLMFLIGAASVLDMTTVTLKIVFTLVTALAIGYTLDELYVSVTSQAATGKRPEDGNVLANLRHWIAPIFKFPAFSRTPEQPLGVPVVPETLKQAYDLPKCGTAGGSTIGTFRNLLSHMVGVDMTNVMTLLHFYVF
jgi:hypothetical protein